jgi:DNA-binding NarL/FixJ family response regulator
LTAGGASERAAGRQHFARSHAALLLGLAALGVIDEAYQGDTNRTIGEQLYLSPRTVQSHMYRIFPKLGITARSQLRDAFAELSFA